MINKLNAKPFVKWVGGKSSLTSTIERMLPGNINAGQITYIEPFVGGGGSLFHMLKYHSFKNIYINDINLPLTDCYRMFQNITLYTEFIQRLLTLEDMYNNATDKEKVYYQLREQFNERLKETLLLPSPMYCALFIFLNKTCFNGLYRVNKKGIYNVPWGKKSNIKLYDKEIFEGDFAVLNNVKVFTEDFSFIKKFKGEDVFIYLDPPYMQENKQSFTSYSINGFSYDEQVRLRDICNILTKNGVKIMESNSLTPEIKELYKEYNIKEISAPRAVSAKSDGRGEVTELLITNY